MNSIGDVSVWVRRIGKFPNQRARLFCFPYAAGSAAVFRNWAKSLPDGIEVMAVQFPGRENRLGESGFTRMGDLIQALETVLTPLFDRPFAFFGHSLGALIAFELARSLQRRESIMPQLLIVSGSRAPQLPNRDPWVHELPDAELIREINRLSGTPSAILDEPELMELLLPLLRADFALYETYRYTDGPPLSSGIRAFWGENDQDVSLAETEGWREQTRGDFELRCFQGNHFFIHSSEEAVLDALSQILLADLLSLPAPA